MFAVEHGANVYTVQRIVGHFEALDHARRARRAVGRLTGATPGESWMQRSGPSRRRPLRAPMLLRCQRRARCRRGPQEDTEDPSGCGPRCGQRTPSRPPGQPQVEARTTPEEAACGSSSCHQYRPSRGNPRTSVGVGRVRATRPAKGFPLVRLRPIPTCGVATSPAGCGASRLYQPESPPCHSNRVSVSFHFSSPPRGSKKSPVL
jgi:hypothetical protein